MTQFYGRRNPWDVTIPDKFWPPAKAVVLAAPAFALGLAIAWWQELPRWRLGGTNNTEALSVTYLPKALVCPDAGTAIAIIGDSHVAGGRTESRGQPFGAVLEERLAGKVTVERYGIGGETAAGSEKRWRGRDLPKADLVILALGTNDAAPRGWLGRKAPVPVGKFKDSLARQIAGWRARGHEVALMAPPPGGSSAITARLAPYRMVVGELGRAAKVPVFDPVDAFAACPDDQPVLTHDALHMNASGNKCLGEWLANQFCPVNR